MIAESKNSVTKGKGGKPKRSIDTYAAQCGRCQKWRKIRTQEEYEEIRNKMEEDPFVCEKLEGKSCGDGREIKYDDTRTWVIDKHGLPKTPTGFKRTLIMRKDYSRMDAYYITRTGKRLRTRKEVQAFIQANEEYKNAPLDDFTFTAPKVMESSEKPKRSKKDKILSLGS